MSELIGSGRIFELIAALLLVEGLIFSLYRFMTGRGIAPLDLWLSLGAGAGLLLAARALAVNASWIWVAVPLLLALGAHAGDLKRRWH